MVYRTAAAAFMRSMVTLVLHTIKLSVPTACIFPQLLHCYIDLFCVCAQIPLYTLCVTILCCQLNKTAAKQSALEMISAKRSYKRPLSKYDLINRKIEIWDKFNWISFISFAFHTHTRTHSSMRWKFCMNWCGCCVSKCGLSNLKHNFVHLSVNANWHNSSSSDGFIWIWFECDCISNSIRIG